MTTRNNHNPQMTQICTDIICGHLRHLRITLALVTLAAACGLSGCAGVRIAGRIETQYGSAEYDGKTVTLVLPAKGKGYAK